MAVMKSDSEFIERWQRVRRGTSPGVTAFSSAVPQRFLWGSEERAETHPTPPLPVLVSYREPC